MRKPRIDHRTSTAARPRLPLAWAAGAALLLAACAGSPSAPSAVVASTPALAVDEGGQLRLPTGLTAANISPADLTARGWSCRLPPIPDRQVCVPPNQAFPSPATPLDERPPSYQLLAFNGAGQFLGTQVLIREDLYQGQMCESTGGIYDYRALIGYYECVHTVGR